jgi:hypothetical protein
VNSIGAKADLLPIIEAFGEAEIAFRPVTPIPDPLVMGQWPVKPAPPPERRGKWR